MIQIVFLLIAAFFISQQSVYIFGGDSAEFSTVAKTWGISHPPGYPLYSFFITILDKLIPFGTTPWKIALLSSIPTILTAFILYKILKNLKINSYVSFVSALLYLFLFPIWQYALIPEVFALHNLLVSLITYLLLKYTHTKRNYFLMWAALLFGLCVSHHHIFILFIPGWFFLLKDNIKKIVTDKKLFIKLIAGVCVGASFYLYPIIASLNHTILDWENAKTLQGLFNLITRSSYGSFKAYSGSGANLFNQLADVVSSIMFILIDYRPLGILFIVVGLIVSYRYSKKFSLFLIITILLHFIFLFYTNFKLTTAFSSGMFERFLIPLYFLLCLTFGIGTDFAYKKFALFIDKNIKNKMLRILTKKSYFIFVVLFVAIIALSNFKTISLISSTNTFDKLGRDILGTLPKNAIVSLQTDTPTFVSIYYVYGERARKDVVLLQIGLLGKQNYLEMLKKRTPSLKILLSTKDTDKLKRFISDNSNREYFAEQAGSYGYWLPYGLLWKYFPNEEEAKKHLNETVLINQKLWKNNYAIPLLTPKQKNILHLSSVQNYYINAYISFSKLLIVNEQYEEAKRVLNEIVHTYSITDQTTRLALLNILVLTDDCSHAKKEAHEMNLPAFVQENPASAKSVVQYYKKCDPINENLKKTEQKWEEYIKRDDSSLHSF